MKYLLDTHVILWLAENSHKLSDNAKNVILDYASEKYVSIVSAWEVAIKLGNGKLRIDGGLSEFYRIIDENGFIMLSVEREYLNSLQGLSEHHKDPFDRILITTAIIENLTLITVDENIKKYDLPVLW